MKNNFYWIGDDLLVKELIKQIEEWLKDYNDDVEHGYYRTPKIDIPFNIVALEQHLSDDKYQELHNDLKNNSWNVGFEKNDDNYIEGKVKIHFDNEEINYEYIIELEYEPRHWGYCECSEEDEGYDERYNCCGHGCDWDAPKFMVVKETWIGCDSFDGDEHDFWDYRDKYNNVTLVDRKQQEKESKLKALKEEMARIQKKIEEIENK